MHATRRVKLKDISSNLTCHLCQGYFVDATTIIECLHSFCRGCIVPHLEKSEYCPVCEVQLHSSKPLSSIRSDQMLQEIVYKLVPGLFQNEMARRRKHYKERSEMKPTSQQDAGHVYNESYITSDDIIHLSLELQTENTKIRESSKRYIKCPAAVSISILKKLLQGKYDLSSSTSIEILYRDRTLPDDFLLMDIAYKYFWSQNEGKPLQLCYKFIGVLPDLPKPMRPSLPVPAPATGTVSTPKRKKSEINAKTPATPLTESKQKKPKKTLLTPKSSNGNGNGMSTPNGKLPRGRPKRKIEAEDGDDTVNKPVEKKLKKDKEAKVKTPKTPKLKLPKKSAKSISTSATATTNGNGPIESGGAEVQLRISENGVISATSVSSGEEKIIVKNPPRPVLATSPTLFTSFPRNFSNEDVPSLTISSELLKRPGVTNGSGHNGNSSGHNGNGNGKGHNGNGHEQVPKTPKSPDKVTISPKDSNGNIFHPWKYSPEKRSRKPLPPNGKIPHDTQAMSPTKRHQTTIINGDFKFTPIISAVKTPPKNAPSTESSSPKKPPKFFKSRHTEMRTTGTETNGDINGKSPVKFPENEFIISAAMFNKTLATGGLFLPNDSSKSPPKTQKTITSESMTMPPPTTSGTGPGFGSASPAPMLDHFSSFRYPMNMNLAGLQNNLPMNLVPFMPNQYQFQPFFNNGPRPNVHAANQALMANALAMSSLNMNLPYPGFPQNPNNNVNASSNANPTFRPHQQPSPSNPNTTLDLSMPSRKPVSSYVQISPKKMSQSQKEPLSFKKGQSPVKRDKGLKSSSQKKTPNKSQPQPMVTEPPNGPTSLNSTTPEKIDVPVILSTIQTDALDFCHGVTTEKAATTVTSVPVPTVAADSPTHNNNNVVSNGKNEHKSPEPETNGHDLGVNLNSPTSSSSPTSNNNNNIPAGAKKLEPSPLLPEPMDSDDDDGGNNLIISESDPSIPTSCGPAVSVNVISSSNTSSA